MDDHYRILGISENAAEADVKRAFRHLVKQYHPDSQYARENPEEAEEKFSKISEAYQVLSDPGRRADYDRSRRSPGPPQPQLTPAQRAKAYYRDGRKAYQREEYDKAATFFRNAAELDPERPLYCSWLGLSLSTQKNSLHEAKKWCEKATIMSPENPDYYVNLALIYRDADVKTLALKYLNKALSLNPSHRRARFWLNKIEGRGGETIMDRIKGLFKSRGD